LNCPANPCPQAAKNRFFHLRRYRFELVWCFFGGGIPRARFAWVRATVDSSGETIYLNLDHADRMQRQGRNSSYTSIQFFEQRLMVTVRETPEELINQIGP
jgi:hypothetical protein